MKNKRVILMETKRNRIFAFAMLLLLAGALFASVNPKVQLADYSISEVPAQPGHAVNLTLNLRSIEWDNCAERLSIQAATSYPLSVQGPDTQYIYSLCANDTGEAGTISFILPVDPLASSGTYQVFITTTYEKRFSKFTESNTINLRVGGEPSFVASVESSSPVDIYVGDSAKVTVTFQNNGSSTVQSARATLNAEDGIEVKWAGSTQEIGQITPRGSASATFAIEAGKNAQPRDYWLEVSLDYVSETKAAGQQKFRFELPVKPKAEFGAHSADTSALFAGEQKIVKIALSNTGTQEAKYLKVRMQPYFPFSTDGTVRYIDSIAPGESVELEYTVTVDKDATAGAQLLGFLVDFEDPQGKKFTDSVDFSLGVETKGLLGQAADLWYVVAGIAVIGLAMFAKKAMGKKK